MRAAFVIDSLAPGGAERSLSELLPVFQTSGIDPIVICLKAGAGSLEGSAIADGFNVLRLRAANRWTRVSRLRSIFRDIRPELVHTSLFEADISGRLAAAGLGIPILTSLVNTSYDAVRLRDPNVRWSRLTASRLIDGWTARHLNDHFHAISETVKDAAIRDLRIPAHRITVIPRGRDAARFGRPDAASRLRAREMLGVPHDVPVLATLGRQEFQKGQRYLLAAMPEITKAVPGTLLLLAGREGNASDQLRATVGEIRLNGQVRILGHREDVPDVLAAADLFVFPSLYEGLGGALIEAMALGLPIVASDLPAVREVLENGVNAVLVPPASPPSIARAVLRLLDNPEERRSMCERSRQIYLERFTLDRNAHAMVKLLRDVGRHGRRRT